MYWAIGGSICLLALGCNQGNSPGAGTPANHAGTTVTTQSATSDRATGASEVSDRTNTGVNVRDRSEAATLPTDQKENKGDLQITADIRKRVVDANMSVDANNVKIITQNGRVTLRGPVETKDEKQRIDQMAGSVAGAGNVVNELEVTNK